MKVTLSVNDERIDLIEKTSIHELLIKLGYDPDLVAVAVGGDFLPQKKFKIIDVSDDDYIDVVSPTQGG